MGANIKKIIALGVLIVFAGARCWGAAIDGRLVNAVEENNVEAMLNLLKGGVSVDGVVDYAGRTALVTAASYGYDTLVRILLRNGAKIDKATRIGDTPLMVAALNGRNQVVRTLSARNANLSAGNMFGVTPLMMAAVNGHDEVVRTLLVEGEKKFVGKEFVDKADDKNMTALMWAAMRGRGLIAQILIDAGADVDKRDSMGRTAVDLAMSNGDPETIRVLTMGG